MVKQSGFLVLTQAVQVQLLVCEQFYVSQHFFTPSHTLTLP